MSEEYVYEYVGSNGHPVHTFRNRKTHEEVIIKFGVKAEEAEMAQKASEHADEIRSASNGAINIPKVISNDFDLSQLSAEDIEKLTEAVNKGSPIRIEPNLSGRVLVMEKAEGFDLTSIIYQDIPSEKSPVELDVPENINASEEALENIEPPRKKPPTLEAFEEMQPDWNGLRAGVNKMNELGIVHEDLKAHNIIIGDDKGRVVFNIIDWGGPKLRDPNIKILSDAEQLEETLGHTKLAEMMARYDARVAQETAQSVEAAKSVKQVSALTEIRDAYRGVRTMREALTATKGLSRGAKMTLAGGVALAGGVLYMISDTHEKQRDLAKELLDNETISQEAYDEYVELNRDIEELLLAENIAAQGPTFILTTPLVENYAKEQFAAFSIRHNLSPEIHDALGMSMFDEKSLGAQFAESAASVMPENVNDLDPSLHALWHATQKLNDAQSHHTEMHRFRDGGSRLGPINEPPIPTQSQKDSADQALREAQYEHRSEFARALSNEETGNRLLSMIPNDVLLDMVAQTAPHNIEEQHPLIEQVSYAQQKYDAYVPPLYDDVFREPNPYYELISAKRDLEQSPDVLMDYLRNNFGEAPASSLEQSNSLRGHVGPSREDMDRALNTEAGPIHNLTAPEIGSSSAPLDWESFQQTLAPTTITPPTDQGIQENAIREFLERTNPLIRGLNPDYQITLPLPDATPPIRIIPVITDPELREQSYDAADHTLSNSDIYDTPEYIEMANIFEKIRAGDETDAQEQLLLASLADHNETSPLLRALTQAYPAELQDITRTTATKPLAHQEEITVSEPVRTQMMGLSS